MRRLLGLSVPLLVVAGLIGLPGESEACWWRARARHTTCPRPCPPVVYAAPCPPVILPPTEQVVSKKTGRVYAISDTGEATPHETDLRPPTAFGKKAKIDTINSFMGKARRVAKVSIANAPEEEFASVSELLTDETRKLRPDAEMIALNISRGSDSGRLAAEQRNIRVRAFIYAFKKEDDNDYHVIIGDPPGTPGARYFNVEVSGLPTDDDDPTPEARQKLAMVRNEFKSFFELGNSGPNSYKKPDPPVEVIIAGSAFWDIEHPPPHTVGPTGFKPKSAWEIHPITFIQFEP